MQTIRQLREILGPESWQRQVRAWRFGVVAALLETGSLALMLPLISLLLAQDSIGLGAIALPQWAALAIIVVLYGAGIGLRIAALNLVARVTSIEGNALGARLFARVLQQDHGWHGRHHSAQVRALILSDVEELARLVTNPLGRIISQGCLLLCIGLVLVVLKPAETLCAGVVLVGSYSFVFRLSGRKLAATTQAQIGHYERRHRDSTEALSGIREVRLAQLEGAFAHSFAKAARGIALGTAQRTLFTDLPKLLLEAVLFLLLIAFMLVLSATPNADGGAVLAALTIFGVAGLKLFPIGHMVYANFASLRSGQPLIERIAKFEESLAAPIAAEPLAPLAHSFALHQVSFRHPGRDEAVFERLSLLLKPGQSLAIVGPSGAGKSTLIDLISGLQRAESGEVLVDGTALSQGQIVSWQRQLRYCPQRPALFDADIESNITHGAVDAVRLARALEIACLDDLPMALRGESIGELGARLSGGQIQRIGLARAFYAPAAMYILDEPTSNLDPETAGRFMDRLFEQQGQAMFVIVTHDMALAARCNRQLRLPLNNENSQEHQTEPAPSGRHEKSKP